MIMSQLMWVLELKLRSLGEQNKTQTVEPCLQPFFALPGNNNYIQFGASLLPFGLIFISLMIMIFL